MKKIITMAGTSIFTNRLENNGVRTAYKTLKKEPYACWDEQSDAGNLNKLETATREALKNNQDDSAEIKSILAIAKGLKEVEVYLLATDTVLSVLACLLIKDWFKDKPQFSFKVKKGKNIEELTEDNIEMLVIKDLRVMSDSSSTSEDQINDNTINSGFLNLIDKIQDIIKQDKRKDDFILNISGGYKAFIPILTIMGQLHDIPLKYIYEGSDKLVEIGTFPLHFDWDLAEQYYPHLNNRFLKDNNYIIKNIKIIDKLKDDFLIIGDAATDIYKMTALGELLKNYVDLEMPHAQSVAGFIAEYKMFEYFHNYPYQGKYSQIKRSFKVEHRDVNKNQEEEIDLELRSPTKQVIVCEVKAFRRIYGDVKKIIERAKARVTIYKKNKENKENIEGYILVIHKGSFDKIELISKNLETIRDGIRELKIDFKIFYIERPDNYQEFARKPLEKGELKEHVL